jgi:hypothetical protein
MPRRPKPRGTNPTVSTPMSPPAGARGRVTRRTLAGGIERVDATARLVDRDQPAAEPAERQRSHGAATLYPHDSPGDDTSPPAAVNGVERRLVRDHGRDEEPEAETAHGVERDARQEARARQIERAMHVTGPVDDVHPRTINRIERVDGISTKRAPGARDPPGRRDRDVRLTARRLVSRRSARERRERAARPQ